MGRCPGASRGFVRNLDASYSGLPMSCFIVSGSLNWTKTPHFAKREFIANMLTMNEKRLAQIWVLSSVPRHELPAAVFCVLRVLPLAVAVVLQAAAFDVQGAEDGKSLDRSFDLHVKPFLKQYCHGATTGRSGHREFASIISIRRSRIAI